MSIRLSKWAVELGQLDIKILSRVAIKGQVLVDFVVEFSPRTVSLEQGCLVSTHGKEESSEPKSVEIESAPKDYEVIKEPPQNAEVTIVGKITGVPKVNSEPPQIDLSLAWKMFADGVKNSLGVGAGMVLKSPEGATF